MTELKRCAVCMKPRDNSHELLCPICIREGWQDLTHPVVKQEDNTDVDD